MNDRGQPKPAVPLQPTATIGRQLMAALAAVDGDHPAIIDAQGTLRYREFGQLLQRTVGRIQACVGVGGADAARHIASYQPYGTPSLLTQSAVIAAGHVLVPLVPEQGGVMHASVLAQTAPVLLVTSRALLPLPPELRAADLPLLILDDPHDEELPAVLTAGDRQQDALIVFTSGSTGRPHGVRISHELLLNHTATTHPERRMDGASRILHAQADVYIGALLAGVCALCVGATVVAFSAREAAAGRLYQLMAEHAVTHFTLQLALIRSLAQVAQLRGPLPHLKNAVTSGEPPSTVDFQLMRGLMAESGEIGNVIGSTEALVYARHWLRSTDPLPQSANSVGEICPDSEVFIVDEQYCQLPFGADGEVVVVTPRMASGYLGEPELTAKRFLPAPDGSGRRAFRTGDRGRLLPGGRVELIGRIDDMVKVRGYRIELAAVNQVLMQNRLLQEGTALATEIAGQSSLVAYIVWRDDVTPSLTQLRAELAALLPAYAVPTRYVVLDALPRSITRKVERHNLPPVSTVRPALETDYVAPTSALERQLAQIWQAVLTLGDVGIDDEFFALGGDSLALFRLLTRIERELAVVVELKQLTLVTVRQLARLVEAHTAETAIDTARLQPTVWQPRRSPTRDIGPLIGGRALPYALGQRLLQWLVTQPLLQQHRLARHVRQWRQVTAEAGLSFDATLELHLINTLWWAWRRRALHHPQTAARWITAHGLDRLQQRAAGQGVVLVTTHSVLISPLVDLLRRELDRDMITLNVVGERYDVGRDADSALGRSRLLVRGRRHLERGGVLFIAGDGRQGVAGVPCRLLGRTVLLRTGAAELATATGAWLVPTFITMAADGRIAVACESALSSQASTPQEQAVDLTGQFADLLVERFAELLPGYNRDFIQTLLRER